MSELAEAHVMMKVTDFLAFADSHPRRLSELLAGVPVAMAPATRRHSSICGNVEAAIRRQVHHRSGRAHHDVGVATSSDANFLAEPAFMVRCGPVDERRRWVSDPIVIFEVLADVYDGTEVA